MGGATSAILSGGMVVGDGASMEPPVDCRVRVATISGVLRSGRRRARRRATLRGRGSDDLDGPGRGGAGVPAEPARTLRFRPNSARAVLRKGCMRAPFLESRSDADRVAGESGGGG